MWWSLQHQAYSNIFDRFATKTTVEWYRRIRTSGHGWCIWLCCSYTAGDSVSKYDIIFTRCVALRPQQQQKNTHKKTLVCWQFALKTKQKGQSMRTIHKSVFVERLDGVQNVSEKQWQRIAAMRTINHRGGDRATV